MNPSNPATLRVSGASASQLTPQQQHLNLQEHTGTGTVAFGTTEPLPGGAPATAFSQHMVDLLWSTLHQSTFRQTASRQSVDQPQHYQCQQPPPPPVPHSTRSGGLVYDHHAPLLRQATEVSHQTSTSTTADSSPPNGVIGSAKAGVAGFVPPGFSWTPPNGSGNNGLSLPASLGSSTPAPLAQPQQSFLHAPTGNLNSWGPENKAASYQDSNLALGQHVSRLPQPATNAVVPSTLPKPPQSSVMSILREGPLQVCVIGSGNWGSAVARVVALNARVSHLFCDTIHMWTYEEVLNNGKKISEVINNEHENPKYLPGVKLPINLVAMTDLVECASVADLLCFVIPHQFVERICEQLQGHLKPSARAVTFVKGLAIKGGIPQLYSDLIADRLQISCDAVSGANVAKDLSADQFCESTVGYSDPEMASIWQQLFDRPCFRIYAVPDPAGVQVCGALKNLVALAAGFCDGLNTSTNSKSAIIRIGLEEMKLFATLFFDGILEDTFNESAGLADMVTTCFGGSRSLRCAAEFIAHEGRKSWTDVEVEVLKGQRLQGRLACADVHSVLERFGVTELFPLFHQCYEIAFNRQPPSTLLKVFMHRPAARIRLLSDCHDVKVPPYLNGLREKVMAVIRMATVAQASTQPVLY